MYGIGVGLTDVPVLLRSGGSAPVLWTPAQLAANLYAWYDAQTLASLTLGAGNEVSAWASRAATPRTVLQGTPANQPIYTINQIGGFPGLIFLTTDNLAIASETLAQPFTLVAMVRTSGITLSNYAVLFDGNNGYTGTRALFFMRNADATFNNRASVFAGTNVRLDPGILATNTNWLLSGIWNGASSRVSNTILNTNTGNAGTAGIVSGFAIGGNPGDPNVGLNSIVGEVLVFNTNLSDTNRQLVEGYLAWRWNVVADTLPVGHPYFAAAPTI